MKNITILLILFFPAIAFGQQVMQSERFKCGLTDDNMKPLFLKVKANIEALQKSGVLHIKIAAASENMNLTLSTPTSVRFSWPLKSVNNNQITYYNLGNFVDLDTSKYINSGGDTVSTGAVLDYMGGERTYDGHGGIDIGIGPYYWKKKQNAEVTVIAAAEGVLVEKHENEFDGNCSWTNWTGSTNRGNHVVILHEDGTTVSYYMHMKKGSITLKNIGAPISRGEYLGAVASSGFSTGPHLHFQVNVGWSHPVDDKGSRVEPFAGPSNYTTDASLWVSQKNYNEPEIYKLETHHRRSVYDYPDYYFNGCDSLIDLTTLDNSFSASQFIYPRVFLRDWISGLNISGWLLTPSGSIMQSWTHDNPENFRFAYWSKEVLLPSNAETGTWQYNIAFNNKTYTHFFNVGCVSTYALISPHSGIKGFIAGNWISSSASISGSSANKVEYRADNYVVLTPGFTATAGSTFTANTKGCINGANGF